MLPTITPSRLSKPKFYRTFVNFNPAEQIENNWWWYKYLYKQFHIHPLSFQNEEVKINVHTGSHYAFNGIWWIKHWAEKIEMTLGLYSLLLEIYIHTLSISYCRGYLHRLEWVFSISFLYNENCSVNVIHIGHIDENQSSY